MIDVNLFKKALGKFATGIAIVTTTTPDQKPFGLTINAFSSLSLDPALVLFCLAKTTRFHSNLDIQPSFTFNILADSQKDISVHFAKPYFGDKWENIDFTWGNNGCPQLNGALAIIECEKVSIHNGGDHDIVIGKVKNLSTCEGAPLLYYSGQYQFLK